MTAQRIVPNIQSEDPAAGAAFYTDILGLEVAMDLGWVITFASPANASAQISVLRSSPDSPHPDYSVEVDDVDAVHRRAVARGAAIVYPLTTEPRGVRRFFVRDPHGKVVNVLSHVKEQQR